MPRVAWINVAPIKGLALLARETVRVERWGIAEDRRFHLIDDDGRLINGKVAGSLMQIRPEIDGDRHLTLHLPDGSTVAGEPQLGERVITSFYGRPVEGRVVGGPFAAAISAVAERSLRLVMPDAPGEGVDRGNDGAVSLLSVAALATLGPEPLDGRRFRMTFGIEGVDAHAEDGWLGREVRIGDEAVVVPTGNVGRCLITSRNPDTGTPDFDTLGALRERRTGVPTTEPLPFGVHATVLQGGTVRLGDEVTVGAA